MPNEYVIIKDNEQPHLVLDAPEEVTVIIREALQGIPGPPGIGSSSPWNEEEFLLSGNQTIFVLAAPPATGTVSMYVNGLLQGRSNFTIVGATITVTGFTPTTGDTVTFLYQG